MKVGKCQAKGEKAKNKKKFNIFEWRRVIAQPRGKKQKTTNKNSKQQKKNKKREKVELNRKGQYFLTKGSHNISKFQFDQESGRQRTTNVDVLPLNYYMLCIYNLLSIYLKTRFAFQFAIWHQKQKQV